MNMKNLIKNTSEAENIVFEFATELGFDADEDVASLEVTKTI